MDQEVYKYFAKELLSVAILLPMVWTYMKREGKNTEAMVKAIRDGFDKIEHAITDHDEKMDKEFIKQQLSLGSTALSEDQTVNLLITNMWFVSYGKLQWIKSVLTVNHIEGREDEIRLKLKTELSERSEMYLNEFRKYVTPIGDLSEWLNREFSDKQFDEFVESIHRVMYSKRYVDLGKVAEIELKLNDVATIMKEIQGKLATKLRKHIQSRI